MNVGMTSRSAAVGGLVAGGMLAVWRAQKKPVAAEEWRLREELACAHWITNHYGMDDVSAADGLAPGPLTPVQRRSPGATSGDPSPRCPTPC